MPSAAGLCTRLPHQFHHTGAEGVGMLAVLLFAIMIFSLIIRFVKIDAVKL
jgi:hypothetical protein